MTAKLCKELYKDNLDTVMESEFSDGNRICPDIKNFTIINEPELYKKGDGTSLNFVVNSCTNATSIDD